MTGMPPCFPQLGLLIPSSSSPFVLSLYTSVEQQPGHTLEQIYVVPCGLLQLAKRPSRRDVGPRSPCLNYHGLVEGGGLLNRPHPNDPELFEENKLPGGHRRHLQTLFLV